MPKNGLCVRIGIPLLILLLVTCLVNETGAYVDDEISDWEAYNAAVSSLAQIGKRRVKRDEESICYGNLGCFRDEGPFDYLDMLPSSPDEIETKFLFYSRINKYSPVTYTYFNYTSIGEGYNSTLPTKVIIHGFGSTCGRAWASEMRLTLLAVVNCNVICLDWTNGAVLPNYVRAAVNTRLVGKQLALLLQHLEKLGTSPSMFHLIGFSLGAHVAGYAGSEVANLSRITGLDPAGPLYESYDKKVRLDESDALFVDVIHSNGDSLIMGGLGSWEPMGHVDFYPNGGRVQKGCSNLFLGAVRDFLWSANEIDGRSLCNHRRAYKFFTESISPRCPFPAFSCENYDKFLSGDCFNYDVKTCGNMGYFADRLPVRGLLYLVTRDEEPFCANQFKISLDSSPSPAPISTYGGIEVIVSTREGLNESFLITQSLKDSMVAGASMQRLIVAHPAIVPSSVTIKYTAYNGWVYSGISRWSLERFVIYDSYGKSLSFCARLLLPSGTPVSIRLQPGLCHQRNVQTVSRPLYPMYPYETYPKPNATLEIILKPPASPGPLYDIIPGPPPPPPPPPLPPDQNMTEMPVTLPVHWTNHSTAENQLPQHLKYILQQLEVQGLAGPKATPSEPKPNIGPKPPIRLIASSRALKQRPVLISRRKGRLIDAIPIYLIKGQGGPFWVG